MVNFVLNGQKITLNFKVLTGAACFFAVLGVTPALAQEATTAADLQASITSQSQLYAKVCGPLGVKEDLEAARATVRSLGFSQHGGNKANSSTEFTTVLTYASGNSPYRIILADNKGTEATTQVGITMCTVADRKFSGLSKSEETAHKQQMTKIALNSAQKLAAAKGVTATNARAGSSGRTKLNYVRSGKTLAAIDSQLNPPSFTLILRKTP